MDLMKKRIDPDSMEVIQRVSFDDEFFKNHMEVRDGNWYTEGGWLVGWKDRL